MLKMLLPFCAAFAGMVYLILLLQGPKLGFYYDFLNRSALSPQALQNIVLIETDSHNPEQQTGSVDLALFVSLLLDLIEIGAESLVVQVPIYAQQPSEPEAHTTITNITNEVFAAMTAFGPVAIDEAFYKMKYTDPDGVLRRIAPVEPAHSALGYADGHREHPVYRVLKDKLKENRHASYPLLVRVPRGDAPFVRLSLTDFITYEWLAFDLQRLLWQSDSLDIYQGMSIMERPSFLGEYVQSVRNIMLEAPAPDSDPATLKEWVQTLDKRKQLWLKARSAYFDSIERVFSQHAVQELLAAYDKRIAAASEQERAGIQALRNEIEACIAGIQKTYAALIYKGGALQSHLQGALCIMGPLYTEQYPPAFVSAVLAQTLLMDNAVSLGSRIVIVLFSLASAVLVIGVLWRFSPCKIAGFGLLCVMLIFIGFSLSFVVTAYWIDPFIPAGTAAAAVICSLLYALQQGNGRVLVEPVTKDMIIVAVHDTNPHKDAALFQTEIGRLFKEAGAYLAGSSEDTIFIAFETAAKAKSPAQRAATCIMNIVRNQTESAHWRFGLDAGPVSLKQIDKEWQVSGNPVNQAKLLALLAPRYQAHALISERAYKGLHMAVQQLGSLESSSNTPEDSFYQLF
jgi:hypothetical protein